MATVGRPVVWSAIVGTAVLLALVPRTHERLTTYASASPRLAAADVVAALALLVACGVGLLLEPARPGLVALGLAVLAWTVQDWAGWYDGPRFAPSIGIVLAPLLVPLLVHAVLAAAAATLPVAGAPGRAVRRWGHRRPRLCVLLRPVSRRNCGSTCLVTNVLLVDGSTRPC